MQTCPSYELSFYVEAAPADPSSSFAPYISAKTEISRSEIFSLRGHKSEKAFLFIVTSIQASLPSTNLYMRIPPVVISFRVPDIIAMDIFLWVTFSRRPNLACNNINQHRAQEAIQIGNRKQMFCPRRYRNTTVDRVDQACAVSQI
jgi:hypothetical protein